MVEEVETHQEGSVLAVQRASQSLVGRDFIYLWGCCRSRVKERFLSSLTLLILIFDKLQPDPNLTLPVSLDLKHTKVELIDDLRRDPL